MGGAGGRGKESQKKTPRPGPFSGVGRGTGPGARRFWGPGGHVTNAIFIDEVYFTYSNSRDKPPLITVRGQNPVICSWDEWTM